VRLYGVIRDVFTAVDDLHHCRERIRQGYARIGRSCEAPNEDVVYDSVVGLPLLFSAY